MLCREMSYIWLLEACYTKLKKGESIWMAYFKWYKDTYNLKMCLRTAINKMDLLMGKKLCTECKKETGHTPSCSKYKEPKPKHLTPLEARLSSFVDGVSMPGDCPASLHLLRFVCGKHSAPSRTLFRWATKTVRLPTGIGVHLQTGILFGITTEWCSASDRNRVHLRPDSPKNACACCSWQSLTVRRQSCRHDSRLHRWRRPSSSRRKRRQRVRPNQVSAFRLRICLRRFS